MPFLTGRCLAPAADAFAQYVRGPRARSRLARCTPSPVRETTVSAASSPSQPHHFDPPTTAVPRSARGVAPARDQMVDFATPGGGARRRVVGRDGRRARRVRPPLHRSARDVRLRVGGRARANRRQRDQRVVSRRGDGRRRDDRQDDAAHAERSRAVDRLSHGAGARALGRRGRRGGRREPRRQLPRPVQKVMRLVYGERERERHAIADLGRTPSPRPLLSPPPVANHGAPATTRWRRSRRGDAVAATPVARTSGPSARRRRSCGVIPVRSDRLPKKRTTRASPPSVRTAPPAGLDLRRRVLE